MPDLTRERGLGWPDRAVAGVDEVGRGPLAGPVVAAAVILPATLPGDLAVRLDDSKKLTAATRAHLAPRLEAIAIFALGAADPAEIDRLNILNAAHLAMVRAVAALASPPAALLVDGNRVPVGLPCPAVAVVGGDRLSLSIAAASILAKQHRDRLMADLARRHPGYGWERNAGYPTAEHRAAIARLGLTPQHRRSFAPCRAAAVPNPVKD